MRSTFGRVAFRGASRFLSQGSPRAAALSTHYPLKTRDLCSTSVVASDGVPKADEPDVSTTATVTAISKTAQFDQPEIGIITDDTIISSAETAAKEGVIAGSLEESGSSTAIARESNGASESIQAKTDPEVLRKLLGEVLQKKAMRSALWYYTSAMKVPDRPAVDENIMKIMLPLLGRYGWAPSSMDTLKLAVEREYNLGVGYYNCGLHAISRSGDTEGFTKLLEGMWKLPRESHPNATSYTYLIGAHIYRSAVDDAFEVLKEMKNHLIYPTFATYHALITGCLRKRDSQRAYSTLLAVEKQRFDVSAMTVSQVLVSSAQNDDCENVLNLISKLEDSLPRYTAEMHRIAENRATYRLNGEERTTKEERAELRGDPKPEIGAISEVLHCAFRNGRADIGMAGWDMLKRYYPDMEVPPTLWYCMIGAFAGAGDFSRAFDVLGAMRESGLKPCLKDLEVALIRPLSFDVAKIDEQFFRLVDKVERPETATSSATETGLLQHDSKEMQVESTMEETETANDSAEADALNSTQALKTDADVHPKDSSAAESISDNESLADVLAKPDILDATRIETEFSPKAVGIDELNCIIASCSFAGDLDRAFQTYDEVESKFHLERNAESFNALLEGCVQVRHLRGGLRILKEMESVGFKVTGSTAQLAVRLLLRGGRIEEAIDIVENIQADGGVVPTQTYQMLVRNCVRGDSLNQAARAISLAGEAGIERRALTGRLALDSIKKLQTVLDLDGNQIGAESTSKEDAPAAQVGDVDLEGDINLKEDVDVETAASEEDVTDVTDSIDHTDVSKP